MATYRELLTQREALDKEIEAAHKAELTDAITRTKAIINEYGLTATQCGFSGVEQSASTQPTKSVAVYYRTPDGTEWSGRGRTPVAILALVNAGHKLEEFLTEEGKVWFANKQAKEAGKANK